MPTPIDANTQSIIDSHNRNMEMQQLMASLQSQKDMNKQITEMMAAPYKTGAEGADKYTR